MPSGKFQLYLEIESKNTDDWNSIRSIVETLNGIDIQPKEDLNFDEMAEDDANSNGDDDDTGSWGQFFVQTFKVKYLKVANSNTPHLEAHADFLRLLMKEMLDPYLL